MTISFEHCDYENPMHLEALVGLLNHYMTDPMGDALPLNKLKQLRLVDGLANHPTALVLFVLYNGEIAGLSTCFINFSTFKAKPYINIHDLIIDHHFRSKGFGKCLLQQIESISKDRNYCKITLEVREDNRAAKNLYSKLGFKDIQPKMDFWTKELI